jgi:hypothetical protein
MLILNVVSRCAHSAKALREQTLLTAEMGEDAKKLAPNFIGKLEYLGSSIIVVVASSASLPRL